jgi:hypothetical protein
MLGQMPSSPSKPKNKNDSLDSFFYSIPLVDIYLEFAVLGELGGENRCLLGVSCWRWI